MNKKPFTKTLAILLVIVLVAPSAFLVAPQRTFAQASAISCLGSMLGFGAGSAVVSAVASVPVSSTAILAQDTISAGATTGSCLDTTIWKPLARLAARIVLQQITQSTINWITGKNGSGKSSFVTNLSVNLQGAGDAVALSFISRTATAFNSPFGSAISTSLQRTYNQQTSQAGFFAANQSTLVTPTRSLASVNSFLNGNWSQGGGIRSWFDLTTQDNNNPYTLYQAALGQVGSNVSQAQTNRRQDLAQSGGFLSWCGTTAAADQTQSSAAAAYQQCQDTNGVNADCLSAYTNAGGSTSLSSGVKPGDSCTNGDGTPGKIQTPGSIIHDYTQKAVVGAGIDQLISAQDLDQTLGAIAMALVNQVLSGSGLLGASSPSSGGRPAITAQLQNYSADNTSAASSADSIAQTTLAQLGAYTGAWNTITTAANAAKTSINALVIYCNAQATSPNASPTAINAQVNAAQTALTTEIAPVLAEAQTAISSTEATKALALKVQSEAAAATSVTAATNGAAGALTADTQALAAAPPSAADIVTVQQNAQTSGTATASPAGSLTVSGGTVVDRMNLISTNATTLKSVCNPVAPVDYTSVMPAG